MSEAFLCLGIALNIGAYFNHFAGAQDRRHQGDAKGVPLAPASCRDALPSVFYAYNHLSQEAGRIGIVRVPES